MQAHRLRTLLAGVVVAGAFLGASAEARTLAAIRDTGEIGLCAHPNSLPFASKTAQPPGFQIEVGQALAKQLGVSLTPDWVLISYQVPRAGCDILLDQVDEPEAMDYGIKLTKPYYRSGVGLAVPQGSPIASFHDLNAHTKVGVQVGSLAAMTLSQQHIPISVFGFEDDMLAALAAHEVDAAAVTPMSAGYYNQQHPGQGFGFVPPDEAEHDLVWNVAVGMRRPDPALRAAIEAALDHLTADGTLTAIYARYGITLQPPK
ncbi:MAG: transporter substrate-binding domain-containing protein [Rhodospirillales bacterium]|nr:transporter substrate-binding domain-containing protein [Rhodospirillales bacterium]